MLTEQQNEIATVLERKGHGIQGQVECQQAITEANVSREHLPLSSDIVAFCSLLARVAYRLVQAQPSSDRECPSGL
jgi:hypothetical protein